MLPSENEAQELGQDQSSAFPVLADAKDYLTDGELDELLSNNQDFMEKVASGAIDITKGIRRDSVSYDEIQKVEADKTPAEPAGNKSELLDSEENQMNDEEPEGKDILKVKASDLKYETPDGREVQYKSVQQVLKANKEKELFIQQLLPAKNERDELANKVALLEQKLAERNRNAEVQAGNTEGAGNLNPDATGEEDIYNPDYLRKIGKTEAQVSAILQELQDLKAEREAARIKEQQDKKVQEAFREVTSFQEDHPEFATKVPVAQLNAEYAETIRRIGVLAKTDGSKEANREAIRLYLEDEGEAGEALRELAEKNGVRLPNEFDTYSELVRMRAEASNRGLTLDEVYAIKISRGEVVKPAQGESVEEEEIDERAVRKSIRELGQERRENHAADIDPAMSGKSTDVDEMDESELADIIENTPEDKLRSDPKTLKLYNMAARRLGMKPLNPHAFR